MKSIILTIVAGLLVGPSVAAAAVVAGQMDDFEDGTVQAWTGSFATPPGPPVNIATGGPAGAGDNYLQVTSTGGAGAGSKLATFNPAQWSGDYIAAGVTAIQVDMKNFSVSGADLEMRLLIPFGGGGDFTSTLSQTVPADGAWHTLTFGLTAADLVQVGGVGSDLNTTLQGVPRILLRHQPGTPTGVGSSPAIAAQLGIDNVLAIPEPATALLLGLGGLVLCKRRRRRV